MANQHTIAAEKSVYRKTWAVSGLLCVSVSVLGLSFCEPAWANDDLTDRLSGFNGEVLRWHSASRIASADRAQAAEAIHARASVLRELIRVRPAAVLSAALPAEVLTGLATEFPDAVADLESHEQWQGSVEQLVFDTPALTLAGSATRLHTSAGVLDLHFSGLKPPDLKSGVILSASGVRLGTLAAVDKAEVVAAASLSCSTTGTQNTAVLLVTFPGVTPPGGITPQSMYSAFFGTAGPSLNTFWSEASHGKTSTAGNVFGYYTLDRAYSCAEGSLMRDAAMAMAASQGVNFQNYSRIFVIYPSSGCTAGFGTVGCTTLTAPSGALTASTAYIQAETMAGSQGLAVLTHEAGHNLGLQHGGTLGSPGETLGPIGAPGTVNEFGDYWSTMGSTTVGLYPASQQAGILGWLSAGSNYQVVQSSGTWTIAPIEQSPAGLQALKIQRGTNNNAWLWVEYRQPIGSFDTTLMADAFTGALVHYEDPSNGAYTRLIDFSPDGAWDTWWSTALQPGKTWTDPYSNVSLTVQSATPTGLTATVNYLAPSCVRAAPVVTLSPANPSGNPGASVIYTVNVKNNDASACAAGSFTLASALPASWAGSLLPAYLTIPPGQTASAALTVNVPATGMPAVYPLTASATQNALSGTGSANITVTAPVSLAVTLAGSGSVFGVRQTVNLSTMASYGSGPASSAKVTFTVTDPTGRASSTTITSDASGNATYGYKIGAKGPMGSYTVAAFATYNGSTARSQPVSFSVR